MCLRVVYIFVQNVELVIVDACKVETMNSPGEELPPSQIENLGYVRFDGLVDCHSQNDAHTLERLSDETWKVLLPQNLVEAARYETHTVNDEFICMGHNISAPKCKCNKRHDTQERH